MKMEEAEDRFWGLLLDYWLRWQVPACALVFLIPAVVSLRYIKKIENEYPVNPSHLWVPCWKNISPLWLLFYRAFAFAFMAFLLYHTVAAFGFFVFFFYTQWTFALVMLYFALGTIVSARGCWTDSCNPLTEVGEADKLLNSNSAEDRYQTGTATSKETDAGCPIELKARFWETLMQIIYQTCAGAVVLTDIVFWCILLPFMTGENFQLTLLIGCMHSVNAVLLIFDSVLNNLPFTWHRLVYFVLWSCSYIVFQWALHACCFTWWPYPFLELSTPWAPLWYLGLALVHIPCYGLYLLLVKAKDSIFSRVFPHAFIRVSVEKKEM